MPKSKKKNKRSGKSLKPQELYRDNIRLMRDLHFLTIHADNIMAKLVKYTEKYGELEVEEE